MKKVHFLHIPKTAGQSVHQLLVDGFDSVSPLRVNSQYPKLGKSSVSEYDVISGHIDWATMNLGGNAEFTFTVLRKPLDRILSFYHYLRSEARKLNNEELNNPENLGMKNALHLSPDEYFLNNSIDFSRFIDDHYDNFYTYFFASMKYSGNRNLREKHSDEELLGMALKNISKIDKIYTISRLHQLPTDLCKHFNEFKPSDIKHVNIGDKLSTEDRINELTKIGECERAISKIKKMCSLDNYLYNFVESVSN
ncbi:MULTISPECIES: sulfotransferase family 2 domain-containing protein [unclassified Endozoicomonas]|uniref:sulfotransferase family 2 domain-containing protein n=1 Tax=unclassified Endozoicomonas TaxID=2644528 RepID=UPI003BB69C26